MMDNLVLEIARIRRLEEEAVENALLFEAICRNR